MRTLIPFGTIICVCFFAFALPGYSQTCSPPPITFNARTENIFSPEQEMFLGDLTLQRDSGDMRFIRDEQLLEYVKTLGERLVKHLPPTGLKFSFHLIDIPEANAFNSPGGHVFLSRKLIAFVNTEDELAGVIAHELGHAAVHHSATDFSVLLKKVLNVTTLGDRRDVAEKYNLLIENSRTKRVKIKAGHEDKQQVEADRIGLFAMVAAGYDPQSFFAFLDRLTESEGKTGGWFSDLFGKTTPDQKRLRELIHTTELLPAACREGRSAQRGEDFLKWQADVVSFRGESRVEVLPGLIWKKEIKPKLRSDVSRIDVSRDGRYLVTRDDFSLTVIQREPLQVLFQIPAEEVEDVSITPDGRFVVFNTASLRVEKWSIAEKKPVEVREIVLREGCWENRLSPDGRHLACVDNSANLLVIDTSSGKRVFQKKEFYQLNYYEYLRWLFSGDDAQMERPFFRIQFTPDSQTVLFSRSNNFRTDYRNFAVGSGAVTRDTSLALDLKTMKPFDIGGDMQKLISRAYVFLDSQRVLGSPSTNNAESGFFSFPTGKRLQKFTFFAGEIKATGNPDYFIIKPLQKARLGVFDARNARLIAGMNLADATIWNNHFIFESVTGQIVVHEMTGAETEVKISGFPLASVDIPVAAIGNLSAAQVSDNFKWVALSSKTRGGLWDLSSGDRKVYATGFRGGIVGNDGAAVSEFPQFGEEKHSLALLNPTNAQIGVIRELSAKASRQYGRFVLTRSSLSPPETNRAVEEKEEKATVTVPRFYDTDFNLREKVRFELNDFVQDKVIWSQDFQKDAPGYSFDGYSGRLMLYWGLESETGKAKLKESPEMKAKADALGNKKGDYLIEIIDAFERKPIGSLLIETGKGSFYLGAGLSEGDWLVLYDSEDRVLIYSIKTGALRHRFFGGHAAMNPVRNQIAVENFPGELSVFNLETGETQAEFVIKGRAAFVRFNLDGNRLFVLSDLQIAYSFDLNKVTNKKME